MHFIYLSPFFCILQKKKGHFSTKFPPRQLTRLGYQQIQLPENHWCFLRGDRQRPVLPPSETSRARHWEFWNWKQKKSKTKLRTKTVRDFSFNGRIYTEFIAGPKITQVIDQLCTQVAQKKTLLKVHTFVIQKIKEYLALKKTLHKSLAFASLSTIILELLTVQIFYLGHFKISRLLLVVSKN